MKNFILFLCVFVFSLYFTINDCFADEVGNELDYNFSNELNTSNFENSNNEKNDTPNTSNEDLFGDEQTFPFIAGLGKNAAH